MKVAVMNDEERQSLLFLMDVGTAFALSGLIVRLLKLVVKFV